MFQLQYFVVEHGADAASFPIVQLMPSWVIFDEGYGRVMRFEHANRDLLKILVVLRGMVIIHQRINYHRANQFLAVTDEAHRLSFELLLHKKGACSGRRIYSSGIESCHGRCNARIYL